MNPGKAIKQDPRSAPDKAPAKAPDVMSKNMPEFPLDKNELQYPGGKPPFHGSDAHDGPHPAGTPAHPMEPPTEMPRNKTHLLPTQLHELEAVLAKCIEACKHCIKGCTHAGGGERSEGCIANATACASICSTLKDLLPHTSFLDISIIAKDLAPVCARACDACAKECHKHPDMPHCVACAQACQDCSKECRSFAL